MKRWLAIAILSVVVAAILIIHLNYRRIPDNSKNSMPQSTLALSISAFAQHASIPSKYTCDGDQVSPAIAIAGVPANAKSLALIMDDPDIPDVYKQQRGISEFVHWVLFNIPPATKEIPEGGSAGIAGANGAGENKYTGPCPPPQYEPSQHRYFFKLYALDGMLDLQPSATKEEVEKAMRGHIIGQTEYIGVYKRI